MPTSLVEAVRQRCHREHYPTSMLVTPEEYEACEQAIVEWLTARGKPPILYADRDGRLLFKNVGLYTNAAD